MKKLLVGKFKYVELNPRGLFSLHMKTIWESNLPDLEFSSVQEKEMIDT